MTVAAPTSGFCAAHPQEQAFWACQRCGTFVCKACERRTRPEAAPLCPRCWDLRSQSVQNTEQRETKRLQIAGLLLGLFSVLHPLVMVASAILNIRELLRHRAGSLRWMHVVGLIGTGFAILVWLVIVVGLVFQS